MTIGLLKEPEGEKRVALLPESVQTLVKMNVKIVVEHNAGQSAFAEGPGKYCVRDCQTRLGES